MITGREMALFEHRLARIDAHEKSLGGPRQLLNVTPKSAGSPWPFDRIDMSGTAPHESLRRPYGQSPWVYRAIQLKVGEVTAVPVKFYAGDQEYTSPEFTAFWARPFAAPGGKRYTLAEGQERLIGWLDLRGQFFIIRGDDWLLPHQDIRAGQWSPLIIARPERMRAVTVGAELVGWVFTDAAGRPHPLLPEQVEHNSLWNPDSDTSPLAPVEVIMTAAESDYLAGVYVRNLMRNNGDQGVFVIAKGGAPTDPQREQIVADLRAKRRAAQRGDFRPVFLTGDIEIEDAKAVVPDANLNQTRLQDRHTVFIGLGVPGSMADVKTDFSMGKGSDREQLISGTCMALAKKVNAPLAVVASRQTGKELTAESDWDEHPVIQEVRRNRFELGTKLWSTGISWKHVNDTLDLGLKPFPGWEIPYLPFSVAPVDTGTGAPMVDPVEDPALAEPADEATEKIKLALLARQSVRERTKPVCQQVDQEFALFACECPLHERSSPDYMPVERKLSDTERAQWRSIVSKQRETVRSFQAAFIRTLMIARAETLRNLAANYTPKEKGVTREGVSGDILFDLQKFAAEFNRAMGNQHKGALKLAGEQAFKELGKDDPFTFPAEASLQFLRGRENKLRGVSDEIYARIKASLEAGYNAGDSTEQIAARARAEFNEIGEKRGRVIALTETNVTFGCGRNEGMRQAGVQWKRWLTSGNDNVRDAHDAANGQVVRLDQPFIVGGQALMYPGDSSLGASAGNTISCFCVHVAEAEGPDE